MTLYLIAGLAVLVIGAAGWLFYAGRKAGVDATEGGLAKAEVKASQAANEAQVNAPRTPEAIDDRLRKGGGL